MAATASPATVRGANCDGRRSGRLKSSADQYGSRKTGLARAVTVAAHGSSTRARRPLDAMNRDVKAGVLMARYRVAVRTTRAISRASLKTALPSRTAQCIPDSETMVSGNLASLLTNIVAISTERADFRFGYLCVDSRRPDRYLVTIGIRRTIHLGVLHDQPFPAPPCCCRLQWRCCCSDAARKPHRPRSPPIA